jgi:hypothetical protein
MMNRIEILRRRDICSKIYNFGERKRHMRRISRAFEKRRGEGQAQDIACRWFAFGKEDVRMSMMRSSRKEGGRSYYTRGFVVR